MTTYYIWCHFAVSGVAPPNAVNKGVQTKTGNNLKGPDPPSSGHFMAYFITAIVFVVIGYLAVHNKQKVGPLLYLTSAAIAASQTKTIIDQNYRVVVVEWWDMNCSGISTVQILHILIHEK